MNYWEMNLSHNLHKTPDGIF